MEYTLNGLEEHFVNVIEIFVKLVTRSKTVRQSILKRGQISVICREKRLLLNELKFGPLPCQVRHYELCT